MITLFLKIKKTHTHISKVCCFYFSIEKVYIFHIFLSIFGFLFNTYANVFQKRHIVVNYKKLYLI
jgi:hypothetical protein